MAMACLRLFTRPPLPPFPLRSLPCFRLRIALSTSWLALRLYFRRPFRRAMSDPPLSSKSLAHWKVQSTCRRKKNAEFQRCESQQPGKNGGLNWSFAFPALFRAGCPRGRGASRFAFYLALKLT